MTIVLAIFAIGAMIIVHEAGHYFVARWSGMRVDKFSLGFGPAILKWRHAGTQFQIAPILFGGFVHIVGMNPHEDYDEKDPAIYPNRPTILRFLTILAGPLTNMLFATVIIFAVYAIHGIDVPTGRTLVSAVTAGEPAEGKLQNGDVIVTLNGDPVDSSHFISRVQASHGEPVVLAVQRAGADAQVTVTPRYNDEKKAWLLGIQIQNEATGQPIGLPRAAYLSVRYPIVMSGQILGGLWDVLTGRVAFEPVTIIGMTPIISDTFRAGWVRAFELLAMLNVYLCLVNLLPLPALDGGRLAFLGYELATRRRPNPRIETAVHVTGGLILIILMIIFAINDIKRLFS